MLTLHFHSPAGSILGPSRGFSIDGPSIRQAPHEEIVARFAYGMWHVRDEQGTEVAALRFTCRDRSLLRFEDHQGRLSPIYGPFRTLHFREESLFGDGEPLAILLPTSHRWQHRATGVRWPLVNLLPVHS